MVNAREQLPEDTGGDELYADQRKQHSQQKERAAADIVMEDQLVEGEPAEDHQSNKQHPEPYSAERSSPYNFRSPMTWERYSLSAQP